MSIPLDADVVVIGGGFFGLRIGTMTARAGRATVLFEGGGRFMGRASFVNQARVHGGYHYPRSVLTAMRARQHYARFQAEFGSTLRTDFQHVYAIGRHQSKVRASEFVEFCRRIRAPLSPAPVEIARQFDANFVEATFVAEEAVFDARWLAELALTDASRAGTDLCAGVAIDSVEPGATRRLRVHWRSASHRGTTECDWVVNATYSSLNTVLTQSALTPIALLHELTEVAIVRPPAGLVGFGVTVMDGPFWSCLPFPPLGAYSLTHVRYTPHAAWRSSDPEAPISRSAVPSAPDRTHNTLMQRDAERFLPLMRDARYVKSLWEVKTVLPRSAGDDGRPILVRQHADAPGLISILGAKIDSVYDVEDELGDIMGAK